MKMTNKLFAVAAISSALSLPALANHYGTAGCGLGSLVFGHQQGKIQILAATTNGTSGSQTFGITTGTSGCMEHSKETAKLFININHTALLKDISKGEGETLNGLSELYRCTDSKVLGQTLKASMNTIYPSEATSMEELGDNIERTVNSNPVLASQCKSFS